MRKRLSISSLVLLPGIWLAPLPAVADAPSYSVSLNAGVMPRYQGSKHYTATVMPGFRADFGNGFFIDPTRGGAGYNLRFANGMFASAAVSYDPGRADENRYGRPGSNELRGMGNIKGSFLGVLTVGSRIVGETTASATLELPISNRDRGWSAHVDLAAPVYSQGADKITVSPSLHFGSRKYMQTYFGVTPQQAADSGFAPYTADSGLQAASLTVAWKHTFSRQWAVQTAVGTTRLLGNAAKSPIVQNKQGYFAGTGIVYTF